MPGRMIKVDHDDTPPTERVTDRTFVCKFQSSDLHTRRVMLALRDYMISCGVDDVTLGSVELVLAEVCNNITEHGYPGTPGPIELKLHCHSEGLVCTVTDHGAPLPEGTPPTAPPDPPWELPEGGFGWHIIRTLTDRLTYECAPGLNRLDLRIPTIRAN